jgi:O-antigen ligase
MYFVIFVIFISLLQVNSYTESSIVKGLPILLYTGFTIYFLAKNNFSVKIGTFYQVLLLIILVIIGLLRSNVPDYSLSFIINRVVSTILLFTGTMLSFVYFVNKKNFSVIDLFANFILRPFLFFCLLNLSFWIAGIKIKDSVISEDTINTKAVLLSYIGINSDRIQFPLSGGFNNYAVIVGALFTCSLVLSFVFKTMKYKFLLLISNAVFLLTLFLIDSRTCLIFPFLICITLKIYSTNKIFYKKIPYIVFLLFLGPLFLYIITPLLANLSFLQGITRNSEELATGNSRFYIWSICFMEFINLKVNHIFGYGDFGHYGSGASYLWMNVFSNWTNGEFKTPHNTFFTLLFDYGYIGALLYIYVYFSQLKKISKLWRHNISESVLITGFFIFNFFVGITETLGGYYIPNYFILSVLFLIISSVYVDLSHNRISKYTVKNIQPIGSQVKYNTL